MSGPSAQRSANRLSHGSHPGGAAGAHPRRKLHHRATRTGVGRADVWRGVHPDRRARSDGPGSRQIRFRCRRALRPARCLPVGSQRTANEIGGLSLIGQRGEVTMQARGANLADAAAIAEIYNQGIEDRIATFETRLRTAEDVASWFDGVHPIMVAEDEGQVIAFAATFIYRPRDCYKGIAEASVYVSRKGRCRGAGRAVLQALVTACEKAGYWKLVSRVFPNNTASRRLIGS